MGTGAASDLQIEIFGELGAIRFHSEDPNWLEVYDVREPEQPLGGLRGFRKLETVQHYDGQKVPDWSMPLSFTRTHVECQYRFLRAIADDTPPSPTLAEGLHTQAVMEAAVRSSEAGRWVAVNEILSL